MDKEVVEDLEEFLKDRLSRYQIEVRRGNLDSLASQAVEYYLALTIPCITDMKENMEQKILYCLWGLAVDDCIDGGGDGQYMLGDTLNVLTCLPLGKRVNPQTPAGRAMNELVEKILSAEAPNSSIGREFFFLDAVDQVKGFTYEQIIHRRKDMATLFEYEEHSTLTKDHRICFDIDLCTAEKPLSPSTIKKFRESFKFLGLALTYQGDIITFESEFFEEKGLNSVIILGIERSILPPRVLDLSPSEKRGMLEKVLPDLFDEIRMRALKYRELATEKLKDVEEVDTSTLIKAVNHFIDNKFPGEKIGRKPTLKK